MHEDFLQSVASRLSDFFSRQDAAKAMGGLLKSRTLANLDSAGTGPGGIQHGKRVLYEKEAFIEWLRLHLERTTHSLKKEVCHE